MYTFSVPTCDETAPMISGEHFLLDRYMTSSTSKSGRGADQSRSSSQKSWSASTNDTNQWIQFDFSYPILVKQVRTFGAADVDEWVTQYYILYRYDDQDLEQYVLNDDGQRKVIELILPIRARNSGLAVQGTLYPGTWLSIVPLNFQDKT